MKRPRSNYHYPGIYLLVNLRNNFRYVGKTRDIGNRINQHASKKRRGYYIFPDGRYVIPTYIENAILYYGWDSFDWCVLERVTGGDRALNRREAFWINLFKTTHKNRGYNVAKPPKRVRS